MALRRVVLLLLLLLLRRHVLGVFLDLVLAVSKGRMVGSDIAFILTLVSMVAASLVRVRSRILRTALQRPGRRVL